MKKKLMIMGIGVLVLLLVFVGSIYQRVKNDKIGTRTNDELIMRVGDMMTVPEALHLITYLGIDGEELSVKTVEEGNSVNSGETYLSFEDGRKILEALCEKWKLSYEEIAKKLSFQLEGEVSNKVMLTKEFLEVYETVLSELPKESAPVTEKTLYILGSCSTDTSSGAGKGKTVLVTDGGEYNYDTAAGYERFYTNESGNNDFHLENYIDCRVSALVSGTDLLYIKSVLNDQTTLHNIWITKASQGTVDAYLFQINREFTTKTKLSETIEDKIGDITIQNGKIIKISIKPDTVTGKVLVANDKYIEVEGYGKLFLDDDYKIYKIYGELSMGITNRILVGYDTTDFVVANGKIVAALIKKPISVQNIRVLIKTDGYQDIFHKEVKVTSDKDFTVTIDKKTTSYKKGTELSFEFDDPSLKDQRISIKTKSGNGKIKLLSLNRSCGNPSYRGTIEIEKGEKGFLVINDLPLEEYLYAVIPSEMPTSYGLEALKVQAVCARSYAYNQLFSNAYSQYGAHVDDSVAYQVYNNAAEDGQSILAVKETYGQVIKYKDSVITAYYFSTSCGHTASMEEVWANAISADYLVGKMQTVESEKTLTAASLKQESQDLSEESAFRQFILNPGKTTYDTAFAWYRWKVTVSLEDLSKVINQNIAQRYTANPQLIQTLQSSGIGRKKEYESVPISSIGTLKSIKVGKREKSGILSEIILVGSKYTVKVSTEYNIRLLLAPTGAEVVRQDNTTAKGLSMLPSAFFIFDKEGKNITFTGGGYGHGVGLSQNGAKAMADEGIGYEDIIKHFYSGVEVGYMY